jgi:hypothetical protein
MFATWKPHTRWSDEIMGLAGVFCFGLNPKDLQVKSFRKKDLRDFLPAPDPVDAGRCAPPILGMEANLRTNAIAAFSGRARGQQTCD